MSDRTQLEDEDDIPDNFFDEFEDNEFLDELVDNVVPNTDGNEDSLHHDRSSSPLVERCLKEIDKLTKDIQRRKRKLELELSSKDGSSTGKEAPSSSTDVKRDARHRRSSRSPIGRRLRSKSPPRIPRSRSFERRLAYRRNIRSLRSPLSNVPNRFRRSRSRERRHPRSRSRSRSPTRKRRRSSSSGRLPPTKVTGLTFLEELERKFAEEGKEFPEKDLLLQLKANKDKVHQKLNVVPLESLQPGFSQIQQSVPSYPSQQPIRQPQQQQSQPMFPNQNQFMITHAEMQQPSNMFGFSSYTLNPIPTHDVMPIESPNIPIQTSTSSLITIALPTENVCTAAKCFYLIIEKNDYSHS